MGQVKTWQILDNKMISSSFSSGVGPTYEYKCEPIYIGAPTSVRFVWELKESVNVDMTWANCASPLLRFEGAINNVESSIWSTILADILHADPSVLAGPSPTVYIFRRFSEYKGPPLNGALLLPWVKPIISLNQNTSLCEFASLVSSITLIAEYD